MEYPGNELIESLFYSEYEKLLHMAESMLRSSMLADDCVQLTFCEAYRQADILATHPNPKGWLRCVLKNKVRDCIKSSTRYSKHLAEAEPVLFVEDSYEFEETMTNSSLILDLIRRELSDQDYRMLLRVVVDEASGQEVAKEFGISLNACYKRLERIRRRLEKSLPVKEKNNKIFLRICQIMLLSVHI